MPLFSVIMGTRNRPQLFRRALESVLTQSYREAEIIVIDDGSSEEHAPAYRAIADDLGTRARWYALVRRPHGHGPSYVYNFAAERARGAYLSFLDDDDWWTDREHLARAAEILAAPAEAIDLYLSNQAAFRGEERRPGPIWIEDLSEILTRRGKTADRSGTYRVGVTDLLASGGFCHMNTLIVRRELYAKIGGMDETIRWESDRDLYLRLIDTAKVMAYEPAFVSRHNIPDPAKTANVTTSLSVLEKLLFQVRVLDRAALFAKHPKIRAHARQHKGYALKKIAEHLARKGDHRDAAFYAREALGAGPTMKWAAYTAWLAAKNLAIRRG